jgi:Ca2+-binding RTX toxin-like protein
VFGDEDCNGVCSDGPADHDVIRGGDGNDVVNSARGPDELDGGAGDDLVDASESDGARSLLGGPGEDRVHVSVREAMNVDVDGGPDPDWLVVEGKSPLPPDSRIVVDASHGRVVSSAVGRVATMRAFESYLLLAFNGYPRRSERFRFRFVGAESGERVQIFLGLPSLRAQMNGGDDVVRGSTQDDVIDGGAGIDSVRALAGSDRCVDVENAHGCELSSVSP